MNASRDSANRRLVSIERYLVVAVLALGLLCLASIFIQMSAFRRRTELVPISLNAKQVASYQRDPLASPIPGVRLGLIADVIRDQEPDADAAARLATVQANLLTPVAWLVSPTPSRTPTRTSTPAATPTITMTPTPADPWISLGYARVGCNTEVLFDTVTARRLRFLLLTGGGNDNHVSFYCCGSNGAAFWVNGAWVHITNQSSALNVGESRETGDVNAVVNRARFNIGCNDKEQAQVQIFYLPISTPNLATPSIGLSQSQTPTATSTARSR